MAGYIDFKEDSIPFSNRVFASTMILVTEVARKMATEKELPYVKKLEEIAVEGYFPGLCFDIEKDFPTIEEQKFWAKMFYETAREIFERKIGVHEYYFWQSKRIYLIYGTGNLFVKAVKEIEPRWYPDTRDFREYDEWIGS